MILRKHQRGLGMVAWIFLLMIAGFIGIIVIKSFPVYMNHFKVFSVLKSVSEQPTTADASPIEVRESIERRFDIDMVNYVSHKDVKIAGQGDKRKMTLVYEVRIPMVYNVDAVYKFSEEFAIRQH